MTESLRTTTGNTLSKHCATGWLRSRLRPGCPGC